MKTRTIDKKVLKMVIDLSARLLKYILEIAVVIVVQMK